MPEINGIDLCEQILKITSSSIIFVSTHMERQPSVDRFYPAMMLPKPVKQDIFDSIILAYIARKDSMRDFEFNDYDKGMKHSIPCREIYFFSMTAHHLMITTARGTFQDATKNLNYVEKEYESESFFRCHKSYIINLRYYKSHDYRSVILECGEKRHTVGMSMGKGAALEKAYLNRILGGRDAF
jgi:DNA-binding LytR/AlgR family response regulator